MPSASAISDTGWPSTTTCRGIASAATSVVIAHVAAGTSTIRVGAGGIMLPNHAPLVIAEQFGTLAALHPGRIDLGLGRAPGTDMVDGAGAAAQSRCRRRRFPAGRRRADGLFRAGRREGQRVRAVPGEGQDVEVWILGSSTYGAQLAAMLGLPYAFASHFAPAELEHALDIYRSRFQPSEQLDKPYVMLGINVFAAPTDAEARLLFSSLQQAFVNLRTGRPGRLPPPVEGYRARPRSDGARRCSPRRCHCAVVGSPETVKHGIDAFIRRTGADEMMVTAQIFDHAARVRSFEILADVHRELSKAA